PDARDLLLVLHPAHEHGPLPRRGPGDRLDGHLRRRGEARDRACEGTRRRGRGLAARGRFGAPRAAAARVGRGYLSEVRTWLENEGDGRVRRTQNPFPPPTPPLRAQPGTPVDQALA